MSKPDVFDLTIPPFPAPFRKWLVSDGLVPYKVKCLGLGPLLYAIGVLLTLVTGTFQLFLQDYAVLLVCIIASVALYGLVNACKRIGPTINDLDKTIGRSSEEDFKCFVSQITRENSWHDVRIRYWYYLHTLGLAAILVSFKCFLYKPAAWAMGNGQNVIWINDFYHTLGFGIMGYITGLGFELALIYSDSISNYCAEHLKAEKIELLPVEELGGLKPLGSLALRINIPCATPAAYAFSVFFLTWLAGERVNIDLSGWLMLIVYALSLTFIFFKPIIPAHRVLVIAKEKAMKHLRRQIRQTYDHVGSDNPARNDLLCNLLSIYQSLRKASTWPLDLPLSLGSAVSILFPLIGGAFLDYLFTVLGPR